MIRLDELEERMKFFIFLVTIFLGNAAFATGKITELNLEVAQKIASKAEACGKKNNCKISIALVNSEGNLKSSLLSSR